MENKEKVLPLPFKEKGLDIVRKYGYEAAEDRHITCMDCHKDDPEEWPLGEDGFPEYEGFIDTLNEYLWEWYFDDLRINCDTAHLYREFGRDAIGYAFMDGVHVYMAEHSDFELPEPYPQK